MVAGILWATGFAVFAAAAGWVLGARAHLPSGSFCFRCGERTLAVQSRPALKAFRKGRTKRWCPSCGWEGMRRRSRPEKTRIPDSGGFFWADPPDAKRPLLWKDHGPET